MKSVTTLHFLCFISLIFLALLGHAKTSEPALNPKNLEPILTYIQAGWKSLERSTHNCTSLIDGKTHQNALLYLPKDMPLPAQIIDLQKNCRVTIHYLPKKITHLGQLDGSKLPMGLLYLPNKYVVPGGMFNEMYGWDSYFIMLGLLESQQFDTALGMLENLFFEIDNYGAILNANRTYYLTRSQPPFLTSSIRAIYNASADKTQLNTAWLSKAYDYAVKDYTFWTSPPHLAGDTGLSRYFDFGDGAVPELDDSGKNYYQKVLNDFSKHTQDAKDYLVQDKQTKKLNLNSPFYQSDRAMRESGFDTSFRFGKFSRDTIYYAPVDLNSLLYKAEKDLEWMSITLHRHTQAALWRKRAETRKALMNKFLWNEKKGMYFDYNYKTKQQSNYVYVTTFYPLWANLASKSQAEKIVANLPIFEKSGGLVTSPYLTGVQWDYPYGWAPLQLLSIQGLYNYEYTDAAQRISRHYIEMLGKNFAADKTIYEKYDVVNNSSKTNVKVGYTVNVTGFGWTNGVFMVLLNKLNKV